MGIPSIFPRPVEVIAAALMPVSFESVAGLETGRVGEILSRQYGVHPRLLPQGPSRRVLGYLVILGGMAVVFSENKFGAECERFTRAHELGHIVTEYLPLRAATRHSAHLQREDASDSLRTFSLSCANRRREAIANIFAAELLAPVREVDELSRHCEIPEVLARVESRFGISRSASRIRLSDLGMIPTPKQLSLFGS